MSAALTGMTGELGFKRRDDPAADDRAWRAKNKEKNNAYHRDYYHINVRTDDEKRIARNKSGAWSRRKRKYGITKEAYEALLAQQNGRCYICGSHEEYNLRVDHN